MQSVKRILTFLLLSLPFLSFNDFIDYWTVKLNGKEIYNSLKDKKGSNYSKFFKYEVLKDKILLTDTLEVEYFTDTPCPGCVHYYFISELSETGNESQQMLGTYLEEQKSLGPRSYKIPLTDILNCGTNGTIKAIYYYEQRYPSVRLLSTIRFK